jgi:O-antigen ligase
MRRLTRYAIWIFVFSVPWGIVDTVVASTSITRFLGLAAVGLGLLTAVAQRRVHKPGPIFWMAAIFVSFAMLSQVWTISYAASSVRVFTYFQFLGLIWLMSEFVRTRDSFNSILLAFWCGALVLGVDVLWNFAAGGGVARYTATGFNPNYVAFTLVIGFPMALRRFSTPGVVRALACTYCIVAPIALLLTASRSAIVAGGIVLCFAPLGGRRLSVSSVLPIAAILIAAAVAVSFLLPQRTLDRMFDKSDIESGYLSGRGEIWSAGWAAFLEKPVLGSGIASFPDVVQPTLRESRAGHNVPLTLLVEVGVVGLALFAALLGVCAWTIAVLPPQDRALWTPLMAALLIVAMAHDSHSDKATWVLLALLAAQRGLSAAEVRLPARARTSPYDAAAEPLVSYARRISDPHPAP